MTPAGEVIDVMAATRCLALTCGILTMFLSPLQGDQVHRQSSSIGQFTVQSCDEADAEKAARLCERAAAIVDSRIGLALPAASEVNVMEYRNLQELRTATGQPSAAAATSLDNGLVTIHLVRPEADAEYRMHLLHETIHAVLHASKAGRDGNLPDWFAEGTAHRVADPFHQYDTAKLVHRRLAKVSDLWARSSCADEKDLALVAGCSLLNYVADSFPDDRILGRIVAATGASGSFVDGMTKATGHSPDWWESRWRRALDIRPNGRRWLWPVVIVCAVLLIVALVHRGKPLVKAAPPAP